MFKLLLLLLLSFSTLFSGKYEFDIHFNKIYTPKIVYDSVLPFLLRYKLTDSNDDIYTQLDKIIRHINFYATPGKYQRYKGLGTDKTNFYNSSLMMASGNMLCSEQATLAAQAFSDQYRQSRLDLVGHTNGELFIDNRWVIVDPMFDMRIANHQGLPATFNEMVGYIEGNRSRLDLPEQLLPRTKSYLSLYKKERFKLSPTAPRKTFFGNRLESPKLQTGINIGVHPVKFIQALRQNNIDIDKTFTPHYLALYIMPNIIHLLQTSPDPKKKADFIQDIFLEKIGKEQVGLEEYGTALYLARQYQIMQRYDKALVILDTLSQSEQVKFYKAQIFFMRKDKKAFSSLSKDLRENEFYRFMHYQLFGSFLDKGDQSVFANFPYKHYTY